MWLLVTLLHLIGLTPMAASEGTSPVVFLEAVFVGLCTAESLQAIFIVLGATRKVSPCTARLLHLVGVMPLRMVHYGVASAEG